VTIRVKALAGDVKVMLERLVRLIGPSRRDVAVLNSLQEDVTARAYFFFAQAMSVVPVRRSPRRIHRRRRMGRRRLDLHRGRPDAHHHEAMIDPTV